MSEADGDETGSEEAVVLDVLPHGRTEDDRPQYQKSPVAYAVGVEDFRLFELELAEDASVTIDDRIAVEPRSDEVATLREVHYEDLSGGAKSELDYVVEDHVADHESEFVDFYNEAQPITLRLHQLNLLPGIGKKLRDTILEERKREPFETFEEMEERVAGLHDPEGVLVDRIMEELQEDELKYRLFARREDGA